MSPLDHRVVQLLRETLEGVLAPDVAAALLFEALGEREETDNALAWVKFVRGPLMDRLVKRLGTSEAASVGAQLIQRLTAANTPARGGTPARGAAIRPGRGPDDRETTPLPTWQLPVIVVVVSAHPVFADRLTLALGADSVAAQTVGDAEGFLRACRPFVPGVIVVDASGPALIPARELAALLGAVSPAVVRTLWRADSDYGREISTAAQAVQVVITPLSGDGDDRIAPLCDIIRSLRRRPGS